MPNTSREILNTIHQALLEHMYLIEGDEKEIALTNDALEFIRRQLNVYELLSMKEVHPVFGGVSNTVMDADYTEIERRLYAVFVSQKPRMPELFRERLLKELYGG